MCAVSNKRYRINYLPCYHRTAADHATSVSGVDRSVDATKTPPHPGRTIREAAWGVHHVTMCWADRLSHVTREGPPQDCGIKAQPLTLRGIQCSSADPQPTTMKAVSITRGIVRICIGLHWRRIHMHYVHTYLLYVWLNTILGAYLKAA